MIEVQEMYCFFSNMMGNFSDPIGQSDLIEKLPRALSDIFFFDCIAIPWRPVA
jgi:hypothetical protein